MFVGLFILISSVILLMRYNVFKNDRGCLRAALLSPDEKIVDGDETFYSNRTAFVIFYCWQV
jgi:hypothetical protein